MEKRGRGRGGGNLRTKKILLGMGTHKPLGFGHTFIGTKP